MRLFRLRKDGQVPGSFVPRLPLRPPPLPEAFSTLSQFAFQPKSLLQTAGYHPRSLLAKLRPTRKKILLAPVFAAGAGALMFAVMMVYYTIAFPNPLSMRMKERAPVVRVLARDGSVLAERGTNADYVPLDLLPRHVQAAVVATEDRRFFEHHGIDPVGLIRAAFANLRAGRVAQGGSTLTQQLAKNLFLSADRTMARKFEELGLALWLELRLSKADILELYLNRVYFGGGAYGIEAASQRYFDKSARELTVTEAALIAGLLKAPSKYSPASSPGAARARGRVVLDKMLEAGLLTISERNKAVGERLMFHEPKIQKDTSGIEYAIDFVLEHMPQLAGDGHGEVVVETTIDADLQRRANQIVALNLATKGAALGASQAAIVLLDADGGIRALVGGRNYADSQFNRAVKAHRQPGSAFKPFVYLAALEAGMTPDTIAYDLPVTIGGWAPRNDNGQYIGAVSLRQALAQSINTVAVRLNQDVGRGRTIEAARRLGIKSDLREGPSLPLGTSEVTLLEMTGAYAIFSNGGSRIEPHAIKRVRTSSGQILFAREVPRQAEIISLANAGAMNDMLNAALVSGTGRRAGLADHPAAGKTGTTQDFRDAWFIGYTNHLTAGVWIGNDNGAPMNRATGGGLPAEIWQQLMQVAHEGKAPLALPGTVRQLPAEPARTAAASSAVRSPRVGQISENLPWLSENAAIERSAPARSSAGRLRVLPPPGPAALPEERISEDFVARALADAATQETGAPHLAEDHAVRPRPQGLMSLGGWR